MKRDDCQSIKSVCQELFGLLPREVAQQVQSFSALGQQLVGLRGPGLGFGRPFLMVWGGSNLALIGASILIPEHVLRSMFSVAQTLD